MTELILVIMVLHVTMVYGPIAAFLVEPFPARSRYASMSLPYHIGTLFITETKDHKMRVDLV